MRVTRSRVGSILGVVCLTLVSVVVPVQFGFVGADASASRPSNMEDFYDPEASVNGCGSQGAEGIDVPDSYLGVVSFTEACNRHDQCYGTEGMTRETCDAQMLEDTLEACGLVPGCSRMAVAYYLGVRVGGKEPYEEGQRAARGRNFSRNRRGARTWAKAHGDPHIRAFDDRTISFQAAGVFRFLRMDGDDLVQARTFPGSDHMSVLTGVAMSVGEQVVAVQIDRDSSEVGVYVDGDRIDERVSVLAGGVVTVDVEPDTTGSVSVWRPDGIQLDVTTFGRSLDFALALPEKHPSSFEGLLFDGGGEGATVAQVDRFDDWKTTREFDASIRLSAEDSWFVVDHDFDYHAADITRYPLPLPELSPDLLAMATAECTAAGVAPEDLGSCIHDVIVGGDIGWAVRSALGAARIRELSGVEPLDVPGPIELVAAVSDGDAEKVRNLLEAGADPNTPAASDPALEGIVEILPLAVAVGNGDATLVELLLEAGADPNAGVPTGGTSAEFTGTGMLPLDAAALAGDLEIMRLLIGAGARADRGLFAGDDGRDLAQVMLSPEAAALLDD